MTATSKAKFKTGEHVETAPLKVCLVADTIGPNAGTEKLVAALATAFDPKVIEARVCCLSNSKRLAQIGSAVRTAVFPTDRIYSLTGVLQTWRFRRYLIREQIDVVHSFMNNSAVLSTFAACGSGCKAVITSRLNSGYWYTPQWVRLFQVVNRFSTHILTNSKFAKDVTVSVEKVNPEKVHVFYPGVDLARFATTSADLSAAASLGIPASVPVVGIVANFRPVKDLSLFLKAAAKVAAVLPETAFLLVGQGPLRRDLEQLAAESGLQDRVYFSLPDGDVRDYLARMSVACLCSESEGLPNAILEYMAAGLPIVATDVGGVPELVHHGVNGYLVHTRSPEDFATPIIRLLQDDGLRVSMGRCGLERAQKEFDLGAAISQLQEFYIEAARMAGRATITRP